MAPDEGNMYLIGHVGSPEQKAHFLKPMIAGTARSAFFMTEPAEDGGAGSDPSMMLTTCRLDFGNHAWVINGRKAFITGAQGAKVGIVMAKSDDGACLFLVDLPDPAIRIERVYDTIDSSMPGGHAVVAIDNLRIPADQMLGQAGEGFKYAQVRLSPARLSHCMRWLGSCVRAHEIAVAYACKRHAFGKPLVDHEGVGFMLAENMIDLKQAELMIDWCAGVLDSGSLGTVESSMTKVAVSEALMRIADRCVQVMGGTGVTGDTIVEQVFREVRAFRIYDGPTEVHKWSLAKKIKRDRAKSLVACRYAVLAWRLGRSSGFTANAAIRNVSKPYTVAVKLRETPKRVLFRLFLDLRDGRGHSGHVRVGPALTGSSHDGSIGFP